MPSQHNQDHYAKLEAQLDQSQSVILVNYIGLNAADQTELRRQLRDNDSDFIVSKNNIVRILLETKTGSSIPADLMPAFDGPVAVLFSHQDPVKALKVLVKFAQDHAELPAVKLGFMDGKLLSISEVIALSKLPGREELLTKLVGQLKGPLYGLVNVTAGNLRGLVHVLAAIKDQKQAN